MPRHLKPDSKRQRDRPSAELSDVGAVPEPSPKWTERVKARWRVYWSSDIAKAARAEADLNELERLFDLYSERELALEVYRKKRMVKGSQGQPVANPMGRIVTQLDSEIRQLADRFGMSPRSRQQLGIRSERDDPDDPFNDLEPYDGDEDETPKLEAVR